jgi:hypothetical protein
VVFQRSEPGREFEAQVGHHLQAAGDSDCDAHVTCYADDVPDSDRHERGNGDSVADCYAYLERHASRIAHTYSRS